MPRVSPTASAASSAAASGSATLLARCARRCARAAYRWSRRQREPRIERRGQHAARQMHAIAKCHALEIEPGEIARLASGASRTSSASVRRRAARAGASRQVRRARRSRGIRRRASSMRTRHRSATRRPARAGTLDHRPSSNTRVSAPRSRTTQRTASASPASASASPASSSARRARPAQHDAVVTAARPARRPARPRHSTACGHRGGAEPQQDARQQRESAGHTSAAPRVLKCRADATGLFRKITPRSETLRNHWALKPFSRFFGDPRLWSLQRRTVTPAFGAGLAICFVPLPIHIPLAALVAIFCRIHIPTIMLALLLGESAHHRAGLLPRLQGRRARHRRARATIRISR